MTRINHADWALETMKTLMDSLAIEAAQSDPNMNRVHALAAAVEQARLNYSVLIQRQGYQYMTHNTLPITYAAQYPETHMGDDGR